MVIYGYIMVYISYPRVSYIRVYIRGSHVQFWQLVGRAVDYEIKLTGYRVSKCQDICEKRDTGHNLLLKNYPVA